MVVHEKLFPCTYSLHINGYIFIFIFAHLCCLISGLERLGASPVVAVLTLHHNLPLGPLLHEHLVYTPAIR